MRAHRGCTNTETGRGLGPYATGARGARGMLHLGGEVARASVVGVARLVARLGRGAHLHTTPCDVVTTTLPVLHFSLNLRFVPVVRFATLRSFDSNGFADYWSKSIFISERFLEGRYAIMIYVSH